MAPFLELSTSELIAVCTCAQEAIDCRKLATELDFLQIAPTRVYEDKHDAICFAENELSNEHLKGRIKHVHLGWGLSLTASTGASSGSRHAHQLTSSLIPGRLRVVILMSRSLIPPSMVDWHHICGCLATSSPSIDQASAARSTARCSRSKEGFVNMRHEMHRSISR